MPRRRLRLPAATTVPGADRLAAGFAAVRAEAGIPEAFPADVLAEAHEAARRPLPAGRDATDLPFVTIDPAGSTDLDQAVFLERRGSGYRVHYAIADVAAFVTPGGAIDAEARRRGETYYAPDGRTPLHPPVLSEGAASLLPDGVRPAALWTIDLDASGEATTWRVERAHVRSREQLSYAQVQAGLDAGTAPEWATLLRDVGRLRLEREAARGGVSLPIPEQEVVRTPDGWGLAFRAPLPVEQWNAQISLLTGLAAARLQLDARVGLLRTLPPATPEALAGLRRTAAALHVAWPADQTYPDLVRSLDPAQPAAAALLQEATHLMRGAGYGVITAETPHDGTGLTHGAIAAPYAHVTAPLRRLVDRFATEVCLATTAGTAVPEWVTTALPSLPEAMTASARRASALERGCVDLVEAAVLEPSVGQVFEAVVVDVGKAGATVQLAEPAVRARCEGGGLELGSRVRVRLAEVSVAERRVTFAPAS